jgi:hypothetical protein
MGLNIAYISNGEHRIIWRRLNCCPCNSDKTGARLLCREPGWGKYNIGKSGSVKRTRFFLSFILDL